ncbi:5'-methylthioadenosine/S-adenosylhomocysteine nucleosidase [Paraliobacillus ryukyuensis]|uniref:5'-methylthioadenosine/S-adenosylhomocysteine nucleosidase n=1 Tax=Paraliobacillus ryukyuensis TaxID=200904 RepID=UPI00117C15BC|nr:5'-methylthioadenosine/S-adenosylhomocysteine nucleosidase [Paraliobacillus ryukyuensis]
MKIGIIGAMDQEIALLKSKMEIQTQEKIANCLFIEGELANKSVVLLQSGIGKVNAAMATTILHEKYQPSVIINTGSAGGFDRDLQVGDIVIGQEVTHHDVDVTAFDYVYGQVPGLPAIYRADKTLMELTEQAIQQLKDVKEKRGLIATGDAFMQDPAKVAFVREKFPELIAAEMEAAAIAQVCHQYETPFVIIRALSDIAGKESSVSFDAFLDQAATHAAELIVTVVQKL